MSIFVVGHQRIILTLVLLIAYRLFGTKSLSESMRIYDEQMSLRCIQIYFFIHCIKGLSPNTGNTKSGPIPNWLLCFHSHRNIAVIKLRIFRDCCRNIFYSASLNLAIISPDKFLNQCWYIVHWTIGNKLLWYSNQDAQIFSKKAHLKMSPVKCRPFCKYLYVLNLDMTWYLSVPLNYIAWDPFS